MWIQLCGRDTWVYRLLTHPIKRDAIVYLCQPALTIFISGFIHVFMLIVTKMFWNNFIWKSENQLGTHTPYTPLSPIYRLHSVNTNLRGSITVRRNTCLFCLDSAALIMLKLQQLYLLCQIQTSHTGGQPNSDTSPMVTLYWTLLIFKKI